MGRADSNRQIQRGLPNRLGNERGYCVVRLRRCRFGLRSGLDEARENKGMPTLTRDPFVDSGGALRFRLFFHADVPLLFPRLLIPCVVCFRALGESARIAMRMPPSLSASSQEIAWKVIQRFPIPTHRTDFTLNSATSFNFHGRRQVYTLCRSASMVGAI